MHPNDGRVVSNFIVQALKGEPITLYGTGSQSRSFCYVDDLVTGMIAMMDQDELVGPVNLGNPGEFTILELATMVKELTGSKSEIVFQPLPQDDPVRRCPDITLAKEKLHWEPTIPLRDGLIRTVDYFRSNAGVLLEYPLPVDPRSSCKNAPLPGAFAFRGPSAR
jgi:UDP-glucuronate decarboxylase